MNVVDRLLYLPLGGSGMFGMNMYAYGWGPEGSERFILVDCGVSFPDDGLSPGVDALIPDPSWIEDRSDRLEAVFITHAHEDHIGALGYIHGRLRAPVYARRFTATVARAKLAEQGCSTRHVREAGPWPETVDAGPFRVGFLPVSHSIPEASALVIDTPAGRLVHTGDLNLDTDPVLGEPHDAARLGDAARGGVHALICDSTNVFVPGRGGSEASLAEPVAELVARSGGLFVATTFASNVARLKTLAAAGNACGRSVTVLGRAMHRMLDYSRSSDCLGAFPEVISLDEARRVPRDRLMLIVTGSQGERQAATAQLARGNYRGIELQPGDTLLFSSKTIPGNELAVGRIKNRLASRGVEVVDDQHGHFHVSGHARRDDLLELHRIFKPRLTVPMHGENPHLRAHADLARAAGHDALFVTTGMLADLAADPPGVIGAAETGFFYLDGSERVGAADGVLRDRLRLASNGVIAAAVEVSADGDARCVSVELRGLPATPTSQSFSDKLREHVGDRLSNASPRRADDDSFYRTTVARAVREAALAEIGKRPEVLVLLSRSG